jgi:DNA-binding NarL/FixJ family response regulator
MADIKILIVEDEAIVALEIQDRLLTLGYQVCNIVSNGEKAIASAEAASPDLVLMDVKLRGTMNGIDTARIIKEKFGIPSVFITAFSDENTLKQIKDHLHYECLLKPFEEDELKEAVGKTLNRSS